jgi:hypothetical protein
MKNIIRFASFWAAYLLSVSSGFGAAGSIVADFNISKPTPQFAPQILGVLPDGTLIIGGNNLYLYDPSGSRKTNFESELLTADASMAEISSDGGLFVCGTFTGPSQPVEGGVVIQLFNLVKMNLNGVLDTDFNPVSISGPLVSGDISRYSISCITADEEGGCFISGNFTLVNGHSVSGFAHFDRYGSVIPWQARQTSNPYGALKMILDHGSLVWVGSSSITRIFPNGDQQSFQQSDDIQWKAINGAAYDPRFGLAIIGRSTSISDTGFFCAVYKMDGSRVGSFKSDIRFGGDAGGGDCIAWDNLGRLLVGGVAFVIDPALTDGELITSSPLTGPSLIGFGTTFFSVKRMLPDGSLDPTWSRALWFDRPPVRIAVLPDNCIVVGGGFSKVCGHARSTMIRLTGDDSMNRLPPHSVRGRVEPGTQQLIMGLVIDGDNAVDVLIRAVGPSLKRFGVVATPQSTKFTVYHGSEPFVRTGSMTNTVPVKWVTSRVGDFSLDSATASGEAAALLSLLPGIYSIVIEPADASNGGEVLGEVYYP